MSTARVHPVFTGSGARIFILLLAAVLAGVVCPTSGAQTVTATIATGSVTKGVAVNPVTNKIYVANTNNGTVTVIDGATNNTSTVPVGSNPYAVAVNPVTNKIYVTSCYSGTGCSNTVTVIDGATNDTSTIPTGMSPQALAVNPVTNKIYVANTNSNTVTVIDGATNTVTSTVNVGTSPIAVAVNPVTNQVYVANIGSANVSVIDGATNTVTSTVTTGTSPQSVAVNPVTNKIYVANAAGNNVTVIDGATNTVVSTVLTGTYPYAVALNPVTNQIYVTNFGNGSGNTVSVIDGATNNIAATVTVGTAPQSLAVNPTTNQIYIGNEGSNNVSVINGTTNTVIATLAAGTNPYAVAVNPVTNKAYVSNQNSDNVTVIDGATNGTSTVTVGTQPLQVAVNPVSNKIYVTNGQNANVSVIDGATSTVTSTINVGMTPDYLAVNPVTNQIYVVNQLSGTVSVIDGATSTVTSTVTVGTTPTPVAVNPVTNKIYVGNLGSNNVSVIDGTTNTVTSTVTAGTQPNAVAVNPLTNQIYVTNFMSNNVTVIDGATNTTSTVGVGSMPVSVAVNSLTNLIYVANSASNNVTVINGATHSASTVTVGSQPFGVAVNPATNKIYVGNRLSGNVTVIDGATNTVASTVTAAGNAFYLALNPATDKIYVVNQSTNNVTVIDGPTNTTATVTAGTSPQAVAVNPVTNQIYVTNYSSGNVTVLTEEQVQAIPLTTTIAAIPGGVTANPTPAFTFTPATAFSPNAPAIENVYFQLDSWEGSWIAATPSGGGNFTGTPPSALPLGTHIVYAYATDGQDADFTGVAQKLIGQITAQVFTVTGSSTTVSTVSFDPASVTGGTSSTGTVTISQAAPAGGLTVYLSSSDPSVRVPFSVTIPEGTLSQTFTATTVGVATVKMVTVTASLGVSNATGMLTVNPAGILSLTLNPSTVDGGTPSVGNLVLSGPAPPAGLTVTLMSSNTSAATVPFSFNILGGATSGDFNVTTLTVAASVNVNITATLPSANFLSGMLTVIPPVVTMLSFNPAVVVSGEMSTGTVTLSGPAPTGGVPITFTSSNSSAFPAPANGTVTVPAGSSSQTFMATAGVVAASTPVTVTATTGATVAMGNVTVVPSVAGTSVVFSPSSLTFGSLPAGTAAGAQTVSVTNNGSVLLNFTSIGITGSGFGLGPATTCPTTNGSLAVGTSCLLSVTFTPEFAGTVVGKITITDSAASSPQMVTLSGTGGMPTVSLSTTTLTFGGQQVNTTSAGQSVTLTNTGSAPLTITSIALGGANPGDFGESDNCTSAGALGTGANCTITITFTPTAVARRSAQLTITDNASPTTQTVLFSGPGNIPSTGFGLNTITTIAGGGQPSGTAVAADLPSPAGVAVDSLGNLIVTLGELPQVVKVIPGGNVSVIAGTGVTGYSGDGGPAIRATLSFSVGGAAVDAAGNVFIADANCVVRRVDAATGIITTAAGNGNCTASGNGGPATSAGMSPLAVALDRAGNLFISDSNFSNQNLIRRVDATTGIITTVAGGGSGTCGTATDSVGDGCPATNAVLGLPEGIALDGSGNLYIADTYDCVIRQVAAGTNIITTVAGTTAGIGTFSNCGYNGDGVAATSATLNVPAGVAMDAAGDLYIADGLNFVVRRVDATTHMITTVAGTPGVAGFSGDGGAATSAKLNCFSSFGLCDPFVDLPFGIALDGAGNLFIADSGNNRVRRVDATTHMITTVAGGGLGDGGPATSAVFGEPTGLAASPAGDIFIGDNANQRVRKVLASTGAISTVAGSGVEGFSGDSGAATSATLGSANALIRDSSGNLFFSDGTTNSRVRRVDAVTGLITTVAGGGTGCAAQTDAVGDGCPATSAALSTPTGLALDSAGNLYIADTGNNRIRRVDAVTAIITTVAGTGTAGYNGDGIAATTAQLSNPRDVTFDDSGNLYIADAANHRVRVVSGGTINTYAGNGTAGFSGDNGPATAARLTNPRGIAFGTFGNLFIADSNNGRIRRVDAATGIITTVAGNGLAAFAGDGGDSVLASFDATAYLAVDSSDNLYIVDELNNRIRRVQFTPSVSATPASLTFPSTAVGVTSAPLDITLTNFGGATTVSSIVVAGNFAETDNCVGIVAPTTSCTISVTFTPAGTGALNGSITINDNAGTGSQIVTLTGTGTTTAAPVVSLPSSVSFGNVVQSTTSGAVAITLKNVGTPPLTFTTNPGLSGPNMADFAIASSTCSTASPVPSGGSCTVMVTFTPSTLAMESASLNFADNASPPNQSVSLSGTGILSTGAVPSFTSLTLPSGALGVPYGADIKVSGGTQPYTFAVTSGNLPVGFSMTATGFNNVSAGHVYSTTTPPATGTFTFGVTVTDSASNMTTATISLTIGPAPQNTQAPLLKGQYALLIQAFSDYSGGDENGTVGSLTFDGAGNVTGFVDSNGPSNIKSFAVTGTYSIGPDNRGFLKLTAAGMSGSFYGAIAVGNVYRGIASTVRITEFNDNNGNDRIGSGFLRLQDPTAFNKNSLAGTYVFGGTGQSPNLQRVAQAGLVSFDNALNVTSPMADENRAGTLGSFTFTGTYTPPDTNGRSVLSQTITPGGPSTSVIYQISANEAVFMTLNPRANSDLLLGSALRQPNPNSFSNSSITGPDVIRLNGTSGSGTSNAIIGLATAVTSPTATLTINYDNNDSGTVATNQIISGPYSVAMNGRASGMLTGTSGNVTLIFYLAQPDSGFVISGGNSAVAGQLVPQVGSPYTAWPSTSNLYFGDQETVTGKEAVSGIAVLSASNTFTATYDDSDSGGRLTFGGSLPFNFTVMSNGHYTSPPTGNNGGFTGYVVSPYEVDFLDSGTGASSSTHPEVHLVQSIPTPPGTPSPAASSVNFPTGVPIGLNAKSTAITITNIGLGPLGFTGVNTAASPDFSASGSCIPVAPVVVVVIQPQATCTITITFAPTVGTATGTPLNESLVVQTDGMPANVTFTLTATAFPAGAGCTLSWTGTAGDGNWTNIANWSTGAVPISSDNVCISTSSTITVSALAAANQTINSLTFLGSGTLSFNSGPLTVTATASIPTLNVTGGTITFSGNTGITTALSISGGTATFNGPTTVGALTLSGGTLGGAGSLTVSGVFTWQGGTVTGAGAFTTTGGILINSGTVTLDTRTLSSNSNVTVSCSCYLNLQNGAMWTQAVTTTFDLQNNFGVNYSNVGAAVTFTNNGTFQHSTSVGTASVGLPFVNTGTLKVVTGALQLTGAFMDSSSGSITIGSGLTLSLTGGAILNLTGSVNGPGTLATNSSTVNFNAGSSAIGLAALTVTGGTVSLASGVSIGATSVAVSGGGTLQGSGTVNAPVTLTGATIQAGIPVGQLTIKNNFTMDNASVLNVALGGAAPVTGYSQLVVMGTATLAGTLNVSLSGGFMPAPAESFTLIPPTTFSGMFVTTNLPPPPAGSVWNLTNPPTAAGVVLMATGGPLLAAAPNPLPFGNQSEGTPSMAMTLTFSNGGNAALMITGGLTPTGGNAGDFAQVAGAGTCSATLPIAIAAGSNCTVQYTFKPSTMGLETTTLQVANNSATNPYMVTLNGTGTAPIIGASPNPLAFGNQPEGVMSMAKTLTFSNTGNVALMITGGLTPTGGNAGDFAQVVGGGNCGTLPITIAAGANCTVQYTFTPTMTPAGLESTTLQVVNNSATNPYMVTLNGTGILPAVTFTPTAAVGVPFGALQLNTTSMPMSVTLQVGAGTGTLQLASIAVVASAGTPATDFAIVPATTTCPTGGGPVTTSCVVNVTFTPTLSPAGNESASLIFTGSNLTGSPVSIPLTGIGASTIAGFTFTVQPTPGGGNPSVVTLVPGQTALFPLTVTPNLGFIGTITVACGTLTPPTNTTICSVSPSTINITASPSAPVPVMLTFQTNCVVGAPAAHAPAPQPPAPMPPFAAFSGIALLLVLACRKAAPSRSIGTGRLSAGRVWAQRLVPMAAALLFLLLLMTWTACVNDPPPLIPNAPTTPAGTYTLPVTATAPGGVTKSVTLTINVT